MTLRGAGTARGGTRESSKRGLAAGKLLAFAALFPLFHFAYDWAPSAFTAIFSGIDESIFQHAKIGWFAWLAASALEAGFVKPRRGARLDFAATRLWGAGLAVGLFSATWYLAPAIAGPLPNDLVEILWAFFALVCGGAVAIALEGQLARTPLPRRLRAAAFAFAAIAVFLFLRFTAEAPWVDFFTPPLPRGGVGGAP